MSQTEPADSRAVAATGAPTVTCAAIAPARVRLAVRNTGHAPLYVLDGPRMPYLIPRADGALLLLQGVNPPDPNTLYNVIEIPTTAALEPAQQLTWDVEVSGGSLHDHYGAQAPQPLPSQVLVYPQVGWGLSPIAPGDRPRMSIADVLAWQHLAEGSAISVSIHQA